MIDTDKYEGHTPAPWEVNNPDDDESLIFSVGALKFVSSANTRLIADAPLLLAEVKRLREAIADVATNMEAADASYMGGFIKDLLEAIE
jgi:hypothetical protein